MPTPIRPGLPALALLLLLLPPAAGATPMLDPCSGGDCVLVGVFAGNALSPGTDKSLHVDAASGMDVDLVPVGSGNEFLAAALDSSVGLFTVTDHGDAKSGTWSIAAGVVDYVAVKAGNQFSLYQYLPGASSGLWSTAALSVGSGNQPTVSNLTFWRKPVPEPVGLLAASAGLALGLSIARRRRA